MLILPFQQSQPQQAITINESIFFGLEKVWVASLARSLGKEGRTINRVGSPTLINTNGGKGWSGFSNSDRYEDPAFRIRNGTTNSQFTFMCVVRRVGSTSAGTCIIRKKDASNGGSGNGRDFAVSIQTANGGDVVITYRGNRVELLDYLTTPSPGFLTEINKRYTLLISVDESGTTGSIFLNGRNVSTSINFPGGTSDWDPQSVVPVAIGAGWDDGTPQPSSANLVIEMIAVWTYRRLPNNLLRNLSSNPWQLFSPTPRRIWSAPTGGSNTYTLTVSGGVTFSGAVPLRRERRQVPSGGLTFSGTRPLLRERALIPSGGVTFSGTAPIIFNAPNIYTINPSGGVNFSGGVSLRRERALIPVGGITFSGTAPISFNTPNIYTITPSGGMVFSGTIRLRRERRFVPAGGVTFSGTAPLIRTRLLLPSGQVTFSGSAPITFIPAGGSAYTEPLRITVGSSRFVRIS